MHGAKVVSNKRAKHCALPGAVSHEIRFQALEASLAADIRALYGHPIYGELKTTGDIRALMESHVFAVWDFMSLVKTLQREVTCTKVPWLPPADSRTARFLNEIVLGEESDEISSGVYSSHCELYLRAMAEIDADTRPFARFLDLLRAGNRPQEALAAIGALGHVRRFVSETMRTARLPAHAVAAAFLFGRENVIPGMFRKILAKVDGQENVQLGAMRLYLDRHISIDEGSHGPLAARLLVSLCADEPARWHQAEKAARRAIAARLDFWDGVLRDMRGRRKTVPKRSSVPPARSPEPSWTGTPAPDDNALRLVLVQPPSYDWVSPSNGLALLQAHCKRAGFRPFIVDSSTRVRKALSAVLERPFTTHADYHAALRANASLVKALLDREADKILELDPSVAAFCVLSYTRKWALALAGAVKRLRPECLVVFGGPDCLRECRAGEYIRDPNVDAVVSGEADDSFPRLLRACVERRGRDIPPIPGVILKRGDRIVDGGEAAWNESMDSLPFMDFSGFPMNDYAGDRIYLNTVRSCVRRCRFCTHFLQQKRFAAMSPERSLLEIQNALRNFPGRQIVSFSDSLVNGNVARLAKLADLLAGWRLERLAKMGEQGAFFWSGMAIIHPTMTPALLGRLKASGCGVLSYGLESGSQRVIDSMDKKFLVKDAETIIRNTRKAGITTQLYLQFGFPGETDEDVGQTLDFIERNAAWISNVSISFSEMALGSDIDMRPGFYGIRTPTKDRTRWELSDGSNTFDIRRERCRRAARLAEKLGISCDLYDSKLDY